MKQNIGRYSCFLLFFLNTVSSITYGQSDFAKSANNWDELIGEYEIIYSKQEEVKSRSQGCDPRFITYKQEEFKEDKGRILIEEGRIGMKLATGEGTLRYDRNKSSHRYNSAGDFEFMAYAIIDGQKIPAMMQFDQYYNIELSRISFMACDFKRSFLLRKKPSIKNYP